MDSDSIKIEERRDTKIVKRIGRYPSAVGKISNEMAVVIRRAEARVNDDVLEHVVLFLEGANLLGREVLAFFTESSIH